MLVGINSADLKTIREKSVVDCLFPSFRTSQRSIRTKNPGTFVGVINRTYPLQIRKD